MKAICKNIHILIFGIISLFSCETNHQNLLTNNETDSTTKPVTIDTTISNMNVDSIQKKESLRLQIRAFNDINFGVECFSSEQYPGFTDIPYGGQSISNTDFHYESIDCDSKL
ncbi:hypothetical protein [Chitinophaga sancti]|uniref:Uncharacterized protein n=1 Tax=Chitinophaga sancti TaxID=1004 RepID=A0A1K1SQF3_9BACT|nr:hypothetical protein [Chitinophaga sancti]WQD61009.1 hypothetical protein U0033_24220 [Chitinophaga sancti]WQG86864.1 hypothetical protein SR876_18255 [Chitinophaga sancti]SFW86460.1 hypothetical protein SAMN05661012_05889 [Chitinophaga sancti]